MQKRTRIQEWKDRRRRSLLSLGGSLKTFVRQVSQARFINYLFIFLLGVPLAGVAIWWAEHEHNKEHFADLIESFWWALVTMTTVGYGDKFPITYVGRIIGSFTMIFGMTTFAMFSARIVSFIIERTLREGSGLAGLTNIYDHFIVCGWKNNMAEVVKNIFSYNPTLKPESLVLIANVEPEAFKEVQNIPGNEKIRFVRGDPFVDNTLHRAGIKKANKVLVIPNQIKGLSKNEIDNQTVMTVMTIKATTKKVPICAELIDSKFEKFLKLADCDEIIHSQKQATRLLGNVLFQPGLTKVIDNLMEVKGGDAPKLQIAPIPEQFLEQSYLSLSKHFNLDGQLLIGLLENTGQSFVMKNEAMREAQKTPDISQLVDNLRLAKNIETNVPIFNPEQNYLIRKFTKAIVIG